MWRSKLWGKPARLAIDTAEIYFGAVSNLLIGLNKHGEERENIRMLLPTV